MSDFENDDVQKSGEKVAPPPGSDYEVAFTYHSDNQLERSLIKLITG